MNRRDFLASTIALAAYSPLSFAATVQGPKANPLLSAPVYGIAHFNPAQTDVFPWAAPRGTFTIDLEKERRIPGGPINIMTLAAAVPGFMWAISSNRVAYVDARDGGWTELARLDIPDALQVSDEALLRLIENRYTDVDTLAKEAIAAIGPKPTVVTGNGLYSVVDSDNIAYANAGPKLHAFGLVDSADPSKGIEILRSFDVASCLAPLEMNGEKTQVMVGLGMTYDGMLVVGSPTGIAVIDREFKGKPVVFQIEKDQFVSNSFAIDDRNGIYLASGSMAAQGDGIMRKIVWTGTRLSNDEADGGWVSPYQGGNWPPAIKAGTGTGSTPTLMGFGDDENRFVVITDGADRMNIVAFWRDSIPMDFEQRPGTKSRRIADQMPITAGQPLDTPWIQSEQSVCIDGFGAFVVNNVSEKGYPDKLIGVLAIGPMLPPARGVERVEWDVASRTWKSAWTRGDVVSISVVPTASAASGIVFTNGYVQDEGWLVTGLDWRTGETVTKVTFGQNSLGNGAYSIMQFLENGDLLFNSIAGPFRLPLQV